ncbi:MAG: hypothetical protein HYZ38_12570 [Mycobacterium sp.]|nr:hypothetical protein [Mycobacterium sp.]
MNQRHLVCAALVGTSLVTLTGCVSDGASNDAQSSSTLPAVADDAAPATVIDACAMLSPQDVSTLLGTPVEGRSTSTTPDMGACTWENPSTYESVSMEIKNSGTAPGNQLPPIDPSLFDPTKPAPDGMRFLSTGFVEFAAGNRANTVQVAVLRLSIDESDRNAVDLARKIAPQVPG